MSSFCLGCGTGMSEGERFCENCGRDSSPASVTPALDPAAAFGLPPETSGKAIFSLVSGICSLFPPFGIVAVIFGHLSLSEIRRSAGRLTGKGLAITGLVLGYGGLAVIGGLIIIGLATMPHGTQGPIKMTAASESSPVAALRTLNTAEIAYAQAHPASGYTCSLSNLSGSWGISADLAGGKKNGYLYALQGCVAARSNGPIVKYQLVAYPSAGGRGKAAFCSNESDTIKVASNGSPQDCLKSGVDLPANEINHQ